MNCLLVFDYCNDVIFTKYNEDFANHIKGVARSQGLLSEENAISPNIIVQIFSPLVTSQRVMSCQFGNSYSSVECEDGLTVAFEEYMGYLFLNIGSDDPIYTKQSLCVFVTLVRYLCGADVMLLKTNMEISNTLSDLIETWVHLYATEQLMLVEATEQLMVNSDLSTTTLQALNEAAEKLDSLTVQSKIHAMIFIRSKILALYSSSSASSLSPRDILFLTLLSNMLGHDNRNGELEGYQEATRSYSVLLAGNDFTPKCIPHTVYVTHLKEGVYLLLIIECGIISISSSLYDTFYNLNLIQTIQMQQDIETLKPAVENLDLTTKKLIESIKKCKDSKLLSDGKRLMDTWDFMKKKYMDFFKNNSSDSLLRAESTTMTLLDTLKRLLNLTAFSTDGLTSSNILVGEIAKYVAHKLETFDEYLKAQALRNISIVASSDSLTLSKYLEEFPGLVHFIYIDRTTHRITTPSLDFTHQGLIDLTREKVWDMVKYSRKHLQEGHLSFMWKDTIFNYSYSLWFEDASGSALTPTIFPANTPKALPSPGLLCGDFFQKLREACFPKMSPNKIRCYELFSIHLGLVTASCVLEQTRRLATSIWELREHPSHPIDLL